MTDTFGSEPHDHDDGASPESDASHESQDAVTEAPPEEAPSEYEFSDEASSEEQPSEKPARRSAFLPIAAALGGILLLGSVAWWQLGGGDSTSLLPPINKTVAGSFSLPSLPAPSSHETKSEGTITADTLAPTPITAKMDSSLQKEGESIASPLGSSSSARPTPQEIPAPQPKPAEPVVQNAPVTTAVAASPAFSSTTVPSPVVSAPVTSASSVQAPSDSERRIEALNARIDTLQKALDQANQQLGQMTAALAASSKPATASPSPAKESQSGIENPAVVALPSTAEDLSSSVQKTETVAPRPKTTHKVAHKTAKASASKEKAAAGLVLRAASPGHAWIAKGASSSELTEIRVGDKVRGIGTVRAIEEHGDAWIVRGTKGTIQ